MQAQEGNIYFTELAERVEYGNYDITIHYTIIIIIIVIVVIITITVMFVIITIMMTEPHARNHLEIPLENATPFLQSSDRKKGCKKGCNIFKKGFLFNIL